jgi:hypothetical protein
LAPKPNVRNWRGFEAIGFDAYNPGASDIALTLRIDEWEDFPYYADRYNQSFILKPGMNRIEIPFYCLVTSGTKGKPNLDKIYRFLIFMGHPDKKHVLYADYIRLFHPGLTSFGFIRSGRIKILSCLPDSNR